jgi:hypothetical protein
MAMSGSGADFACLPWQFLQLGAQPRNGADGRIIQRNTKVTHYQVTSQFLLQLAAKLPHPSDPESAGVCLIGTRLCLGNLFVLIYVNHQARSMGIYVGA